MSKQGYKITPPNVDNPPTVPNPSAVSVVSEVQLQAIRDVAISVLANFMNDAVQWGAESYNPPRVILEHPGSQIDVRADEIVSAVKAVLEGSDA